jgi:hypothetical protein
MSREFAVRKGLTKGHAGGRRLLGYRKGTVRQNSLRRSFVAEWEIDVWIYLKSLMSNGQVATCPFKWPNFGRDSGVIRA